MGLLVLDRVFERIGLADRRHLRGAHAQAIDELIALTQREVAVLNADMIGVQSHLGEFGPQGSWRPTRAERGLFRDLIEQSTEAYMVIDPRPGLRIVDINDAYAQATLTQRRRVAGEKLFDIFPDNPDDPEADGVSNLFASIRRAAQSGKAHAMIVQRYDVQDAHGRFVEKRWKPVNIPILDESGRLVFVLHHAVDLTAAPA